MKTSMKSLIIAATLFFTIGHIYAFDYNMPDEESESPQPIKSTPKKSSKPKSKAAKKARKIKKAAKKKATQVIARPASKEIQDQIRLINEKIDRLEAGQLLPQSINSPALGRRNQSDKLEQIPIPGTNTVIKIGGYVKADAIYDPNQFTGDASNLPNLRLRTLDADATRSNVFTAHAKQTRISLGSETNTEHGRVMAYFEGDFFGNVNNMPNTGNAFNRSDSSSLNSYNFRVRHAYGSYCYNNTHRLDIGQMWTLFYDPKAVGTTVEFNGPESTAQIRRPQVRYSLLKPNWRFSFSVESGATEYLDISPAFVGSTATGLTAGSPSTGPGPFFTPTGSFNPAQYRRTQSSFLGGLSGDGNQALPDLVTQVVYEKKNVGHASFGAMVRELKIKKVTSTGLGDPIMSATRYGYGIAVGGRKYLGSRKSSVFTQLNFGKGIGTYIFALDGYGAAIDASRGLIQTQFAAGFLVGGEHYWSERWRSNLILSIARAHVASLIPSGKTPVIGLDPGGVLVPLVNTGYSISRILRQAYINLLWSPAEKFELGIEYAYFRRDTINGYYGYGNRFQFGAYYKF